MNSFTRHDPYPVPDIQGILHRVGGAGLISTFDATSGYWQTRIRPGDEYLTAFISDGDGVFEFLRTPFGGKACGSTFVRAVSQVLSPLKGITDSYVDDMIVFTSDGSSLFSRHMSHLESFLKRIQESGITLKLSKCHFAQTEVKFCGRMIGSGKIRPDPEKIAAVHNVGPAKTKKEVRRLLGFFGYFRDHIDNFAAIAKPLTDLTAKTVPNAVPWCDVHTAALEQLKCALCVAADKHLSVIDFRKPFNLHVDASDMAVAGYLSQVNDSGVDCPVSFFSSKLNASQKAWATVHKEAYAVIVALKKFKHWLFGATINVYTDHNPLKFMCESAPKNSKLMRWFLALQEFDIVFHYVRGQSNVVADSLSRL